MAQRVKHLPAMQETWVRSLGQEDPLEKEMATHSSTLAWKIPWTEKPGRLQSMGSQRVRRLSYFTSTKEKITSIQWKICIEIFQGKKKQLGLDSNLEIQTIMEHKWKSSVNKKKHSTQTQNSECHADKNMNQIKSFNLKSWKYQNKPERKTPIQYTNAYIWNLERW